MNVRSRSSVSSRVVQVLAVHLGTLGFPFVVPVVRALKKQLLSQLPSPAANATTSPTTGEVQKRTLSCRGTGLGKGISCTRSVTPSTQQTWAPVERSRNLARRTSCSVRAEFVEALLISSTAFLALLILCASARATDLNNEQLAGKQLFNASCTYCHGERGHATTLLAKRVGKDQAQLEQRTNLSPELIRQVVRHGINSMPWYRRAELSDSELNSIITYLTLYRSQ